MRNEHWLIEVEGDYEDHGLQLNLNKHGNIEELTGIEDLPIDLMMRVFTSIYNNLDDLKDVRATKILDAFDGIRVRYTHEASLVS